MPVFWNSLVDFKRWNNCVVHLVSAFHNGGNCWMELQVRSANYSKYPDRDQRSVNKWINGINGNPSNCGLNVTVCTLLSELSSSGFGIQVAYTLNRWLSDQILYGMTTWQQLVQSISELYHHPYVIMVISNHKAIGTQGQFSNGNWLPELTYFLNAAVHSSMRNWIRRRWEFRVR